MSVNYSYTKSGVCSPCLIREIEESEDISTAFERIQYNQPSDLNLYFEDTLSTEEESALDTIVSNHDGSQSQHWVVWCDDCGQYSEYWGPSFPTICPISGDASDSLIDVTGDPLAIHGYPVRETNQAGYYEWWLPGGNLRRYSTHRTFIRYDSKLTFTPTISFGTVIYDGTSNLRTVFVGKEGFVIECQVTQVRKRFGGLNVKFTWTGVKPT